MAAPRVRLADEVLRCFTATLRSVQLYSEGHPIIARNLDQLTTALRSMHEVEPAVVIGLVADEIIVNDAPMARIDAVGSTFRRLQQQGVERIAIDRGVTIDEVTAFIAAIVKFEKSGDDGVAAIPLSAHIRVGRVTIEQRVEGSLADLATARRIYNDAVSVANSIYEAAATEGQPDAAMARVMIDGLAQSIATNQTMLLALTTLKDYDNYTFTHMVNVAILTMGQARSLGVDGALLREFGLAALMHDIGKVRTPLEILNKPAKLTESEFVIMRRHVVDGAEILRKTPDIPTLAPVVAFEHHLRIDGTGYPFGVQRPSLNLGTMLCSIADVFDAMRSNREYQGVMPTDRILAVLKRSDGQQFDQQLVRRFVQLIGIYPAGTLVRLDTGEIAVVREVYAADTHRSQVRVFIGRDGLRLDTAMDLNLWESTDPEQPSSIVAPLDPANYQVDPLTLL